MNKKGITLSNGEQYYYIDTGDGNEVLVLLHGNMSSSVHFEPLIERLKDSYRIIAPDLRGFGDSSYKKPFESLHDLADDVIDLLRLLSIKSYFLGGWSTGGAIALSMAAKVPDHVNKLILIESASHRGYPIFQKDEAGTPMVGKYYETKEDLAKDPVQVAPMVGIFDTKNVAAMDAIWKQVIYTVNQPSEEDNKRYLEETLKQRNLVDIDWALTTFNMSNFSNGVSLGEGNIGDVTCPVLSIWSNKDITVLEYMIDETVEALPNAKKVVLKDAGHSPLVDKPDELTNNILNFLK
ncbi:MAG: alpha/beta hydrolase [Candidatus Izemoplasma sp.]|nr:alpha/beta hydrolase [Candidatus Izemoplasma sp.]